MLRIGHHYGLWFFRIKQSKLRDLTCIAFDQEHTPRVCTFLQLETMGRIYAKNIQVRYLVSLATP